MKIFILLTIFFSGFPLKSFPLVEQKNYVEEFVVQNKMDLLGSVDQQLNIEKELGNLFAESSKEDSILIAKRRKIRKKRRRKMKYSSRRELAKAMKLVKALKYKEASKLLFRLAHSSHYKKYRNRIKYILGLLLYQMKLHQVSAFQFISVIRSGDKKFIKQSLEKLSLAASYLGDDTLLNYAISRIAVDSFPKAHRDMLFYRIGEFQLRNEQYESAAKSFSRVSEKSEFFPQAKYMQALAYSYLRKNKKAIAAFEELIDARADRPVTDTPKVAAIMGLARVYYQMKDWDKSIEFYREVPRDHPLWHDTLFESSWAMFRSGRFRSALGNFQSLHSPFYEKTYLPESLLVRSLVYLYICQYDEMEKVLNIFVKIYRPLFKKINRYLKTQDNPLTYFKDIVLVLKGERQGHQEGVQYPIPLIASRKILKEGDFRRSYDYIRALLSERRRLKQMPLWWRKSGVGRYANKILKRRLQKSRKRAGRLIRLHLLDIREDLVDLFEQEGFIRYEMINGKKEALKKKLANKELPPVKKQVDEDTTRDFYIQNGWQYYKFRGEYWLDELGNYHYVGNPSCK
ncbi:MAG: hypothetical protein D6797_05100 [Bdellovibrio sp.]|nr:MAG: hypothetical protein D6797_05100 [Bdellovibrio sp.]